MSAAAAASASVVELQRYSKKGLGKRGALRQRRGCRRALRCSHWGRNSRSAAAWGRTRLRVCFFGPFESCFPLVCRPPRAGAGRTQLRRHCCRSRSPWQQAPVALRRDPTPLPKSFEAVRQTAPAAGQRGPQPTPSFSFALQTFGAVPAGSALGPCGTSPAAGRQSGLRPKLATGIASAQQGAFRERTQPCRKPCVAFLEALCANPTSTFQETAPSDTASHALRA